MDQLTEDLKGVAVYMDDILVSGSSPQEHLSKLQGLLQRLTEKGLRYRLEKFLFAQPSMECLGHLLSHQGIAKGPKVDAVKKMPAPTNVQSLRSFLGSVQFYSKFLPNLSTILTALHQLIEKGTAWKWDTQEQEAFDKVKDTLTADTVLVHFNPSLHVEMRCLRGRAGSCFVHRYPDGTERPRL